MQSVMTSSSVVDHEAGSITREGAIDRWVQRRRNRPPGCCSPRPCWSCSSAASRRWYPFLGQFLARRRPQPGPHLLTPAPGGKSPGPDLLPSGLGRTLRTVIIVLALVGTLGLIAGTFWLASFTNRKCKPSC